MKISSFGAYPLSACVAAAALAGCGALPLSLSKGQDDMQPPTGAMTQARVGMAHKRIGLWVTLPETDRLLGLTANGKKTIAEINTAINSCAGPRGIKDGLIYSGAFL